MPVYESIPAYADERRMDAAPAAMESAPGDAVYASQHYHAPKLQSRAPALDTTYSSMTMSPMESSLDGTKTIRGILSRYTPVQGVQYFRDLAGNIRQVCVSSDVDSRPVIRRCVAALKLQDRVNCWLACVLPTVLNVYGPAQKLSIGYWWVSRLNWCTVTNRE